MTVFIYTAAKNGSEVVQGTIAADSPREARERLRAQGLSVQQMSGQKSVVTRKKLWRRPNRHAADVTFAVRELSTLLAVGIPLLEALDTLVKQHRGKFRTAMLMLRDRVASGSSLKDAMAEQPLVFDSLCINMVEVGENAGNLDVVLGQLASFNERYLELKDRVITAILYPTLVLFLSIGVSIFLMTVVVPMLLTNLLEAGRPLPLPTRILKSLSDILTNQGWWLFAVAVGVATASLAAVRTTKGRRLWHRAVLSLPIVGQMARKQAIARIALVVSTLMKSGIVFLKAVEIAGRSSRNLVIQEALSEGCDAVGAGRDIGPALEKTGVFPPMVVQMFAVGQQTGRLEETLDRLAESYDRQVSSASTRLASVLEPVLIVFLAVVVGFILFATVLPILEAGNVL